MTRGKLVGSLVFAVAFLMACVPGARADGAGILGLDAALPGLAGVFLAATLIVRRRRTGL
jgi:hypothetical protein